MDREGIPEHELNPFGHGSTFYVPASAKFDVVRAGAQYFSCMHQKREPQHQGGRVGLGEEQRNICIRYDGHPLYLRPQSNSRCLE